MECPFLPIRAVNRSLRLAEGPSSKSASTSSAAPSFAEMSTAKASSPKPKQEQPPLYRDCIGYVAFGIYLGSHRARNPRLLREQGITDIIALYKDEDELRAYATLDKNEFRQLEIQMFDVDSTGSTYDSPIRDALKKVKEFLQESTEPPQGRERRILFHCVKGRSRSVATLLSYIVDVLGATVADGLLLLSRTRLEIMPQLSFIDEVKQIEEDRHAPDSLGALGYDTLPGAEIRDEKNREERVEQNRLFYTKHKLILSNIEGRSGRPRGSELPGDLYKKCCFIHVYKE